MALRQYLEIGCFVAPALVAGALAIAIASMGPRPKGPPPIVAEPAPPPAEVAPVETPAELPGLAVKRFGTDPALRAPRPRRAPVRLELIDPWNGEDLAPVLAAIERPRLDVNRVDPWDRATQYPYNPSLGDPPRDTDDPWVQTASVEAPAGGGPLAAKKPALDTSNPWDSPPAPEPPPEPSASDDKLL